MKINFKKLGILLLLYNIGVASWAQQKGSITLEKCQQLAKENYPLVKQRNLIVASKDFSLANASKGYLPQFQLMAQASYQSDVTKIPIPIPGMVGLSKDQYKVYAEINQTIYDGGTIKNQKKIQSVSSEIEINKLDVELRFIQEKVNNLYFGILLFSEQLKQNEIVISDINTALKRLEASVKFGILLKSNENSLRAELYKVEQKSIELVANRKAYFQMLSLFINQNLDEYTIFETPVYLYNTKEIRRPELTMFANMEKLYAAQSSLLASKNLPKLNLFFQGGYGRPALNMLNNDFTTYYLGGVRINWNFSGLYTLPNERRNFETSKKMVSVQQETFLFNTSNLLQQQTTEIEKLNKLISTDANIISLRLQIKENAAVQLQNGIIQASDYLRELNAADLAQQSKITHEIQLLLAQFTQQITKGN